MLRTWLLRPTSTMPQRYRVRLSTVDGQRKDGHGFGSPSCVGDERPAFSSKHSEFGTAERASGCSCAGLPITRVRITPLQFSRRSPLLHLVEWLLCVLEVDSFIRADFTSCSDGAFQVFREFWIVFTKFFCCRCLVSASWSSGWRILCLLERR